MFRDEFREAAQQGFGDRHNSKAWAMTYWKDQILVGTARASRCAQDAALALWIGGIFKYPVNDPDLDCTESPQDLPLRAEIWRWTPETDAWQRVYRSPEDVEIPDHPGKYVARDIGFRDAVPFVNPETEEEVVYLGGVTSRPFNPGVAPPRLLYSANGLDFEAVPQDPGTVLGDLPMGHNGMRSMEVYKDRLFVAIGKLRGEGRLYEASHPLGGNDHFRLVSPPRMQVYAMREYNGYLYCGLTADETMEGYYVVKTEATGEPPYAFTPVVREGGYLTPIPSNTVVSMHVYKNRLYVGTDKPAELIRINPDDTWDLIAGAPRETPDGYKYPLSGMHSGFNWLLNEHIWRMEEHEGWLYISTNDMTSLNMKNWPVMNWPVVGDLLTTYQGGDLLATRDGVYYTVIDRTGFGDGLEIGIRTFASTPHGLFCGTSNPYYGCRIWRGEYRRAPNEPTPPLRLEAETTEDAVLLSWGYPEEDADRMLFRVYRALGSDPPREIGVTRQCIFADVTEDRYNNVYYVTAESPRGDISRPSNSYLLPSAAVPMTFGEIFNLVARFGEKGDFASPGAEEWLLDELYVAFASLQEGRTQAGEEELHDLRRQVRKNEMPQDESPILAPHCAEDLEIFLNQLTRRLRLVNAGFLPPAGLY